MSITDWIGLSGVSILLVAYYLNVAGVLLRDGIPYLAMNFAGASIACYASWRLDYWPFILLEGVWSLVSLVALVRKLRNDRT